MFGWLQNLESTILSQWIRESAILYPLLEIIHILAIAGLVGPTMLWDLRLLGAWRKIQIEVFREISLKVARIAFLFVVISGALLFISSPIELAQNRAFQIKLVLISLAIGNAVLFHHRYPKENLLQEGEGRIHGGLSLILWTATVAAGRLIAYL